MASSCCKPTPFASPSAAITRSPPLNPRRHDSMDRRYHYMLGHGTGVRLLASLNGVPFYRCEPSQTPMSRSGLANHLLRPDQNTFSIHIEVSDPASAVLFTLTAEDDTDNTVYRF